MLVEIAVQLLFASAMHDVTRDVVMVDLYAIGLVGIELGRVGSVDTGSLEGRDGTDAGCVLCGGLLGQRSAKAVAGDFQLLTRRDFHQIVDRLL